MSYLIINQLRLSIKCMDLNEKKDLCVCAFPSAYFVLSRDVKGAGNIVP